MRLLSPDDKCIQVDVRGYRYSGKSIEVDDPAQIRDLRAGGYTAADVSGRPSRAAGFECYECGFQSYFRLCSRCGSECDRPDVVA